MLEKDFANIQDCLFAIKHIEEYIQDIATAEELMNDAKTYDAVLMNFIIIGEAANRLSEEIKKQKPNIDWRSIIGFRNFVAHDYFGVDINIVWAAITIHLPELKSTLNAPVD